MTVARRPHRYNGSLHKHVLVFGYLREVRGLLLATAPAMTAFAVLLAVVLGDGAWTDAVGHAFGTDCR